MLGLRYIVMKDKQYRKRTITYIGALTVNIEFMWRGLETGKKKQHHQQYGSTY
jgi:hypothetical protein